MREEARKNKKPRERQNGEEIKKFQRLDIRREKKKFQRLDIPHTGR